MRLPASRSVLTEINFTGHVLTRSASAKAVPQ